MKGAWASLARRRADFGLADAGSGRSSSIFFGVNFSAQRPRAVAGAAAVCAGQCANCGALGVCWPMMWRVQFREQFRRGVMDMPGGSFPVLPSWDWHPAPPIVWLWLGVWSPAISQAAFQRSGARTGRWFFNSARPRAGQKGRPEPMAISLPTGSITSPLP